MWKQSDFCDADRGFDYVFSKMSAIYGAAFTTHWRTVDPTLIRQIWKETCGRGLTYRPKMDYALQYMNPDKPPSALAFAKLLTEGPGIPDKPHSIITKQRTAEEVAAAAQAKEEALKQLRQFLRNDQWKMNKDQA